jgi:hypothetical protein
LPHWIIYKKLPKILFTPKKNHKFQSPGGKKKRHYCISETVHKKSSRTGFFTVKESVGWV